MHQRYRGVLVWSASLFLWNGAFAQVKWVSSTPMVSWQQKPPATLVPRTGIQFTDTTMLSLTVDTTHRGQVVRGFGACFNELGWMALRKLTTADRENILREFFAPGVGANFTICRMPVGANDFSRDWYSYDETPGDFSLVHFSIDHDRGTLIPYIRAARHFNPSLQLWASPWCPPSWMKVDGRYACAAGGASSGASGGASSGASGGGESLDEFRAEAPYLKTYAAYFARFIRAYRKEGISIGMVMPQNEFNSCQIFPSCTWTAGSLARFVGEYLGPALHEVGGVTLFFGTMERPNAALVDTLLGDPAAARYIRGVGFQWAGKGAIATVHREHPALTLYQSEQECGDGKNSWSYALYTWSLMHLYFTGGADAYMYWNLALPQGGVSHWGWTQNSLVTVDTVAGTYRYTPDYYVLKHLSHFIKSGAHFISCGSQDALAFLNPDHSVVIVVANTRNTPRKTTVVIGDRVFSALLPSLSVNTFNLTL